MPRYYGIIECSWSLEVRPDKKTKYIKPMPLKQTNKQNTQTIVCTYIQGSFNKCLSNNELDLKIPCS